MASAATDGTVLLYRSSNGDEWHLTSSTPPAVLHRSNPASGGTVTSYDIDTFLTLGNGPEQQALRLRQASSNS